MIELRDYQKAAIDAARGYVRQNRQGHPLLGLPTGSGKSLVAAELMRSVKANGRRALYLTMTEELVTQTLEDFTKLAPEVALGATLACAGLGKVDLSGDIVLGTAQSVYRRLDQIGDRAVIIVDEAHGIPRDENSMYGAIFNGRDCIKVGLSATPYRLDSGRLDEGDGAPFTQMVYQVQTRELQKQGFLCQLKYRKGKALIDASKARIRQGEFVVSDLEAVAMNDQICREISEDLWKTFKSEGRRRCIVFCVSVKHAEMMADKLRQLGARAIAVSNETRKDDRRQAIAAFKAGDFEVLCNVNIASTGFNVPNIDMVASCAPTMSTGRWVQTVGRGLRVSPEKDYCLVKDYAGNTFRHGMVEEIERGNVKPGNDRAKLCVMCEAVMPKHATRCPECGAVQPVQARSLQRERVIDLGQGVWLKVVSGSFSIWQKDGRPDSFRCSFRCENRKVYSLWLPYGHEDPWFKAQIRSRWLALGGLEPVPLRVEDALVRANIGQELQVPTEIMVKKNPKNDFMEIKDMDL